MNQREQLELAAKAMGYVEFGWMGGGFAHVVDNTFVFWQPDTDQADSDRMACKLRIEMLFAEGRVIANARHETRTTITHNNTDEDVFRAVREARLLVAAEIGKGVK